MRVQVRPVRLSLVQAMKPFPPDRACSLTADGTTDGIRWCEGMRLALEGIPENHEGKGLSLSRGWFGEEPRPRVGGIFFARKARDAAPLVLNFCPWCGASIRFDGE